MRTTRMGTGAGAPGGWPGGVARTTAVPGALLVLALAATACNGPELETRTFQVRYLQPHVVGELIEPYVYVDREGRAGRISVTESAVTVRETGDNLERIARVLEEYDRPRPTVMLHFQIIRANGSAAPEPAIADVERELRRLFRFDGYQLVAETQVGGIQGTGVRQAVGDIESGRGFMIEGGVTEVRTRGEPITVTLDVRLSEANVGEILGTTVTVPAGHSVVLGTAQSPAYEGALILVVRADVVEAGAVAPGA